MPPEPRARTMTSPGRVPPAPPPAPPSDLAGRVMALEVWAQDAHRTSEDIKGHVGSMDETLKELLAWQKAEGRRRKWLDWATRVVLGAALVSAVHWAGKVAVMVQGAKLP